MSSSSHALEDMFRQRVEDNLQILSKFPVALQSALILSDTLSPAQDASTNIKVKSAVSECLNAIRELSKLSGDLDLLSETFVSTELKADEVMS
jgi:hypothetical protein